MNRRRTGAWAIGTFITLAMLPAPSPAAPDAQRHWAFSPVARPDPPAVKDPAWVRSPIDRFILARLEESGYAPSPPADRRTLIRRAAIDLLGLPPGIEEVEDFERSPDLERAWEGIVDRYLASPRYGERWGRYWLDVARYADTKGYVFTEERRFPYGYTYRDYVIRAFNDDLPYDRFIREQLAADLLPPREIDGSEKGSLAAMGFLTLGRRFLNNLPDIVDDRIDVATRGLLGLTVTCARCHDHKFDPIPTRDYYSLYGIFASAVEPSELPLIGRPADTEAYRAFEKGLQAKRDAAQRFIEKRHRELADAWRDRAGEYLLAVIQRKEDPPAEVKPSQIAAGDLHPLVIRRWRKYLQERGARDPVFTPWRELLAVPEQAAGGKPYAERAQEVLARFAPPAGSPDPASRWNGRVLKGLAARTPAAPSDVAARYGEILSETEHLWREALQKAGTSSGAGEGGGAPAPPAAMSDPELEELRLVLHGPDSPCEVPLAEAEKYFNRKDKDDLRALRKEVESYQASSPGAPPRAMSLVEAPKPVDPHVFVRGNPGNPGPEVPRQFLECLSKAERSPFQRGSGRLELAEAIASKENPLTARVMANRIWMHHFGEGLVRTPADFGARSEPPLHRELLDWLAAELMDSGWSLKQLHRRILLSSVYRQSAEGSIAGERGGAEKSDAAGAGASLRERDPENRFLGRWGRRRLDFEALRDSILAVSGKLDLTPFGPAVEIAADPGAPRRSIYGFIDRQNLPGLFRTFDFANPDTLCPQRHVTTVPQQALYLLNSAFLADAARSLLQTARRAAPEGEERLIDELHRRVYARHASPEEVGMAQAFLRLQNAKVTEKTEPQKLSAWERYAQVLLMGNELAFAD